MVETDNFSAAGSAFVLNPNTHRIYILGTSSLTVVDAPSHSVIAKVPFPANNTGGRLNAGLAVDTSANKVYASVQGEVVEVDGSTNTLVGVIPVGLRNLAFDSATHVLWGTMITVTQVQGPQSATGSLIGVDVRTNSVVENVSIGFAPYDIAVDPRTNMVYADGCAGSFVCGSEVAVVNGARGNLVATVDLGSAYYPTMTLNPATHVVYVSGDKELAALNGTTASVIFKVDPRTCGPFAHLVVVPSSNMVLTAAVHYNYLLAYDGATGKLVNMYSFESSLGPVAFDPHNGEVYVATSEGQLLAIRMYATTGNVNSTLIGAGQNCLPP
jgi:DNA-binding beta-propeller fold protein YncE